MTTTGALRLNRWLLLLTTTAIWGCTERLPSDPRVAGAISAPATAAFEKKPELGSCDSLRVPKHNKLTVHAFASGVQIYQWTGTSWSFVAPQATLFADKKHREQIAVHFAGPTWESNDGSTVVGATLKRCVPDAASIPWLLLQAASTTGPGIFEHVTFIQRLNTVGGNAPSAPGTTVGQAANVPYTAEYFFYRAK